MTRADKRALLTRMCEPALTFVGLMVLLAINVAAGDLQPFPGVWILNLGVLVVMIATVLLFSMEVIQEPPLVRLFSVVGFCWVAILFTITLIDYLTR